MPKKEDLLTGRIAVEKGFLSEEQVTECMTAQGTSAGEGKARLLDVALDRGLLTDFQASQILKAAAGAKRKRHPIPGFRLDAELGRGGMGMVYRATQLSLDRPVAIKVLPSRLARDSDYIERFRREARSAAKLIHTNVVQAIEVGETPDNHHYFVMEFVQGQSVQDLLATKERLGEQESIGIARQIADALHEAHRLNLIHRDIKPGNVLVTPDGTAKLADFGLARETSDDSITQTGIVMGTPNYMSPEQARGVKDLDSRSDIYSLGATLYHMVTGRVPFQGESTTQTILMHLEDPPTPPKQLVPELSEGLDRVILRMLEKDRDRRYATPAELVGDLERVASGAITEAATKGPPAEALAHTNAAPALDARPPRPRQASTQPMDPVADAAPGASPRVRNLALAGSVAAGIVFVLLVLGRWGGRGNQSPSPEPNPAALPPVAEGEEFVPDAGQSDTEPVVSAVGPSAAESDTPPKVVPEAGPQPEDGSPKIRPEDVGADSGAGVVASVVDLFEGEVEVSERHWVKITYRFDRSEEMGDWTPYGGLGMRKPGRKRYAVRDGTLHLHPLVSLGHKASFADEVRLEIEMERAEAAAFSFRSSRPDVRDGLTVGWNEHDSGTVAYVRAGLQMPDSRKVELPPEGRPMSVSLSLKGDDLTIKVNGSSYGPLKPRHGTHKGHVSISAPPKGGRRGLRGEDRQIDRRKFLRALMASGLKIKEVRISGKLDDGWLESALEEKRKEMAGGTAGESGEVAPDLKPEEVSPAERPVRRQRGPGRLPP